MSCVTDCTIGGRPAWVKDLGRVRSDKSRSFYSLMQVGFKDTGETLTMPAGKFAKWSTRLDREARESNQSRERVYRSLSGTRTYHLRLAK